jgi:hypothetical protein
MKSTRQDKSGQSKKLEPTIKRSRAAELLDKTPRTLARYEAQGLLHPIKLNCRAVVYRIDEVQRLLSGKVQTSVASEPATVAHRTANGTFGN